MSSTTAMADPLADAIMHQADDLTALVAELRVAAEGHVSTADRARVLLLLADTTEQLDALLDKLSGARGALPEDAA